jgi:hypothetical protein
VDEDKLDEAFKILTKASTASMQEPNECQIFGNLVAKKLQKYSAELQTTVQQDIMNILFKADRSHQNQHSPHNPSQLQHYHPLHHSYSLDYSTPQHSQSYPVNQRYLTLSHTPQKSSLERGFLSTKNVKNSA